MVVITLLNIVVVIMAHLARFEKHRYLLAWAFVLLAFVLGVRYGYGNDYFSYKYMFDTGTPVQGFIEDVEPGWYFLMQLFKPFGFSSLVFLITCIEHLMLYDLIRRYIPANYYWLAMYIYVFNPWFMLIGLSMMRQFLVQILGFYAIECAYKRKLLHFVVIVVIAFSIHKIALLLVPLYFISYASKLFSGGSFSVVLVLVAVVLATKLDVIIESLILFFEEGGMKYGESYLNESVISEEYRVNPKLIIRYLLYVLLLVRNLKSLNGVIKLFAIVVVLSVLFLPFATISPMAIRTSWIYAIVVIVSMPCLLQNERIPIIKYGAMFFFALLLLRDYQSHFISEIYGPYYANYYTILSDYAINGIRLY
jgi:hypothetical protein